MAKMTSQKIKLIGGVVLVIMVLNLVLFSFTVISWFWFLVVLLLGFLFVKFWLPKIKEKV